MMISNLLNRLRTSSILKNVSVLVVAEILIRVSKFIVLALAARVLGPEDFGIFGYILAFAGLLAVIGDLGINRIITRNLAIDFQKAADYIQTFNVQVLLFFIYGVVGALAMAITHSVQFAILFLILSLFSLGNVLGDYLWAFFRAKEVMHYEAIGKIAQALCVLVAGLIFLWSPWPLSGLVVSYSVGALVTLFYGLHKIKSLQIFITNLDWAKWRNLLSQSWPIAIISVSAFIFNEIDSIMLGVMSTFEAVGLYSAAYKITAGLLIPIFIFNQVLFPRFSRLENRSAMNLVRANMAVNALIYLVCLGIVWLYGAEIMTFVFGAEFAEADVALRLLVLVALLTGLMYPLSSYAIAKDYLRINLYLSLIAAALNIGLNLWLIPEYGIVGAASATVATYAFLLVGYSVLLWLRGIKSKNSL